MEEETTKSPKVRDLFVWQSPSKPTLIYPKGAFLSLGGVLTVLTVILMFFQEWLAIGVTWATYFLFFALTKVPAITVEHKITTEGIVSMNHSYIWQTLGPFWFVTHNDELVLHIAGRNVLGHLALLVDPKDREKLVEILAEYLPYVEVPEKSPTDKLSDWFFKRFGK